MCFFFSLLPATVWATVGYFVLFSSSKTEGKLQKFGQILSIWIFVIASFFPLVGLYVTISGLCPFGAIMEAMQSAASS